MIVKRRLRSISSTWPLVVLAVTTLAACATRTASATGRKYRPDPMAISRASARLAAGDSGPFFEFEVEKPVRVMPHSAFPAYPPVLKTAGREGEVFAQFVVDREGRAVPHSFKVLRSRHPLFSQAVQEVLPRLRFTPAQLSGRPVLQIVQQPFTFSVRP